MRRWLSIAAALGVTTVYFAILVWTPRAPVEPEVVRWRPNTEAGMFREAAYSPAERTLVLRFASGHVYLYRDVPPECGREFLDAEIKGAYFNRHIRRGFQAERLWPVAPRK